MIKLWCVYWDRGMSNVKFNLLTRHNFSYRLGVLLTYWKQFEIKLQIGGWGWKLKGPEVREIYSQTGKINKLGVQCQEIGEAVYQYNREVQPGSIKAINITNREFWQCIWDENPRLQYAIYRECPNGPDPFDHPAETARNWVNYLKGKVGSLVEAGLVTHIECYNEWIHSFQSDLFPAADTFMATFIDEVHQQFGGKAHAIVLNSACGHFSDDIVAAFPKTLAKLHQCGKCFLGMHEYDGENLDRLHLEDVAKGGDGFWLCGKFRRIEKALQEAGLDNVHLAITELGLDDAVQRPEGSPHRGWEYYGPDAVAHYLDEHNLGWYYPLLAESEMTVLASIFGCQMYYANNWGEWGFDIRFGFPGLLNGIKDLGGGELPDNNGGNDMTIKIYDFDSGPPDGVVRDWAWLTGVFGDKVKVHPVTEKWQLEDGQLYAAVDWLDAKVGDTSLITNVRDEDGKPLAGITNVFYWPDAPAVDYPDSRWFWTDRGKVGDTNTNGDDGPGMGPGAYYDKNSEDGGPHKVWLADLPSEMVSGLGMLPGGDPLGDGSNKGPHAHLNVGYRLKKWQGGGDGEEPPSGDLAEELRDIAADLKGVAAHSTRLEEIADVVGSSCTATEMTLTLADGRTLVFDLTEVK